ncbi:MAG: response regulator [Thermodesulfobacteriota bacterium]|nr:response regulator [Thermodesulfobacteriota bacterium]
MYNSAKLLIVDDNVDFTKSLADILELKGYDVSVCHNGYETIETVKDRRVDLILMDIRMPGIDGIETYKRIREISPETVTIMMTAYALEHMVKDALIFGAYDILYKPLDIDRVLIAMEESLKGQKSRLILIVDDDQDILDNLKDIIEGKGYTVFTANSGQKAIELARTRRFRIIFIDVKMPILNGLKVYKTILEIDPCICAVMMTGYPQEVNDIVKDALDMSAYTCLKKPLEMDKVLAVIDEISKGKKKQKNLKGSNDA